MPLSRKDAITGCLLGTALGDAVGLCCEGMTRQRQAKFFPALSGPQFFLGRGMMSDDTEHACMVAQSLIVSGGDEAAFLRDFAKRLRFWFLGIPAGIGLATLKSSLRLWCGLSPARSGVRSAGNGPAMRSAVLGVAYGNDAKKLTALVRICTRITHTDPKAEFAALAVALAAHRSAQGDFSADWQITFCTHVKAALGADGKELAELIQRAADSALRGESTIYFADALGLHRGVTGYSYHTVPVVMHAWFLAPMNFRQGILAVTHCGGDTDTNAAVLGSIMGASHGKAGLPVDWLSAIVEKPRSLLWIEQLGERLADSIDKEQTQRALPLSIPALLLRNIIFVVLVLAHGFRRLAPPY